MEQKPQQQQEQQQEQQQQLGGKDRQQCQIVRRLE